MNLVPTIIYYTKNVTFSDTQKEVHSLRYSILNNSTNSRINIFKTLSNKYDYNFHVKIKIVLDYFMMNTNIIRAGYGM